MSTTGKCLGCAHCVVLQNANRACCLAQHYQRLALPLSVCLCICVSVCLCVCVCVCPDQIFDTADSYGTGALNGRSEELLGQFIR